MIDIYIFPSIIVCFAITIGAIMIPRRIVLMELLDLPRTMIAGTMLFFAMVLSNLLNHAERPTPNEQQFQHRQAHLQQIRENSP